MPSTKLDCPYLCKMDLKSGEVSLVEKLPEQSEKQVGKNDLVTDRYHYYKQASKRYQRVVNNLEKECGVRIHEYIINLL